TLAALACANALDQIGRPRTDLLCVSMPGLGTTGQTRRASQRVAAALGASFEEEDIREEAYIVLKDQGHRAAAEYEKELARSKEGHSAEAFVRFLSHHPDVGDVEF